MPTVYNFERWLTQVEVAADGATARGTLPAHRHSEVSVDLEADLCPIVLCVVVCRAAGSEVVTDLFVPEMGTSYEGIRRLSEHCAQRGLAELRCPFLPVCVSGRKTQRASGKDYIYFALDDRFFSPALRVCPYPLQ